VSGNMPNSWNISRSSLENAVPLLNIGFSVIKEPLKGTSTYSSPVNVSFCFLNVSIRVLPPELYRKLNVK
jgi:hypothetical protein